MKTKVIITDPSEVAALSESVGELEGYDKADDIMIHMMDGLKEAMEDHIGLSKDMSEEKMMEIDLDQRKLADMVLKMAVLMKSAASAVRGELVRKQEEQQHLVRHLHPLLEGVDFRTILVIDMNDDVLSHELYVESKEERTIQ